MHTKQNTSHDPPTHRASETTFLLIGVYTDPQDIAARARLLMNTAGCTHTNSSRDDMHFIIFPQDDPTHTSSKDHTHQQHRSNTTLHDT